MMDVMTEFYEGVIFPHFDERLNETNEKLGLVAEEVKDIKEDVSDLVIKSNQNTCEHDRMFVRFDQIEEKVDGHEGRIKKLEKTLQTS